MKRIILTLATLGAAATLVAGCSDGSSANNLVNVPRQFSYDPSSLASPGNTQHHFKDPNIGTNGITDPTQVQADNSQIGSPEVVARLHACSKIPYASLGSILSTRGVSLTADPNGAETAGTIYQGGASAMGVPNYAGRVPEMLVPSTAALAKMFDVLVAAAPEVQANLATSSACPGVALVSAAGVFSKDGISCLIGKPASDDHVTIANAIVAAAPDVSTGVQIAIASMLEAAHTCE